MRVLLSRSCHKKCAVDEAPCLAAPIVETTFAIIMAETLSEAVQKLWELDSNRCEPNQDYQLNVQEGKKPYVLTANRTGLRRISDLCH
jgi:hypothetical protein